jgi:hypothetical protein
MIYRLIGHLFYSRQQNWERRKNAKILLHTLAFTVMLGIIVAKIIRLIYNHQK